jgi:hypothetical protein
MANVIEPKRIWWARPRKLCALERPGGGGMSHRAERREGEIAYLRAHGVRLIVSTMASRHNLREYDRAGIPWHHVPVAACDEGEQALEELLPLLRRELRARGAVAVHGNLHTDFAAAVCAAHLHERTDTPLVEALGGAASAGLPVTPAACRLLGVDHRAVVREVRRLDRAA